MKPLKWNVSFFSSLTWVVSLFTSEMIALQLRLAPLDNLAVVFALATPQVLLLLLLRLFRVRAPVLLGGAFALALQPVLSLLAIVFFSPSGQWWWVYILTLPGAVAGGVALLTYDKRVRDASPAQDTLRSFCLLVFPILVNVIICLKLGN